MKDNYIGDIKITCVVCEYSYLYSIKDIEADYDRETSFIELYVNCKQCGCKIHLSDVT